MSKLSRPAASAAALFLLLSAAHAARAQERGAPKMEVGAHFTTLELNPPEFPSFATSTEPGVGGRFAYNVTDYLGLEGELNFLPRRSFYGRGVQGQFGAKVGKRFRRAGVFAKARPGFLSFGEVFAFTGRTETFPGPDGRPVVYPIFAEQRRTHFTVDVGGVVEFYPSRKYLVRVDAGDTIINYRREELPPNVGIFGFNPEGLSHNFQLSAGVAYRFGSPDGADETDPPAPEGDDAPRFEVGVQYTALGLNRPTELIDIPSFPDDRVQWEPAVGGRFTFNLNDSFALEGALDFFTREQFTGPTYGGLGVQGQFGVKAGRRFRRFGLFAKARPGLLSYGRVLRLVGTETINFADREFVVGRFRADRKTYFEADLGGVAEFYPSRRIVTRFDFGDTVVWYRDRVNAGFSLSQSIIRQPDETRHNFQFGAGLGFRF